MIPAFIVDEVSNNAMRLLDSFAVLVNFVASDIIRVIVDKHKVMFLRNEPINCVYSINSTAIFKEIDLIVGLIYFARLTHAKEFQRALSGVIRVDFEFGEVAKNVNLLL